MLLTTIKYHRRQDLISIIATLLCMVHCVALPLFFSTLGFWGFEVLENIWIEMATILTSLFIGSIAIWRGYKNYHHMRLVPVFFVVGMLLMVAGNFIGEGVFEMATKLIGAAAMMIAHTINWKRIHKAGGHAHAK